MTRIVIIGGSDAGISAALRAREVDATCQITLVVADAYPNYSICGLPYYLSGEVRDWRALAHRTRDEIDAHGITLLLEHQATRLDLTAHTIYLRSQTAPASQLSYDRLVIATGATPRRPTIDGLDQDGVFFLHSMESSFQLQRFLTTRRPRRVAIIGGGYIGLEMAEALAHRGLRVTLVQRGASVLSSVDAALGQRIRALLERHRVTVAPGMPVSAIARRGRHLHVCSGAQAIPEVDAVLVATGVEPNTSLGRDAGLAVAAHGAIVVDQRMVARSPDVYAAGDCVVTHHRLLPEPTYLPLGTTAHKQGRVAGENAAGGERHFAGSVGTQVVKVFESVVARTGLREQEALAAGYAPLTVEVTAWDHKAYYPGAQEIVVRLTADRETGRLLGAQMLGAVSGAIAKRIDVVAAGLQAGLTVNEVNDLDLSYTPPLGSPWDPLQAAAQAWLNERGGHSSNTVDSPSQAAGY
jgi:NADPH-dependent 2,4-dienoyl-CoA reductase/sulfur reductase-like enzyme